MLSSAFHSMKGGDFMREVFDFILAVGAQDKPVRLMEDWLLFVQMARN